MSENKYEEVKDKVVGEVKETTGEVFDDEKLELEGGLQKGMGKARELAGDVMDELEDVKDTVLGSVKERAGKYTDNEELVRKGKEQSAQADSPYTKTILTGLGFLVGASLLKSLFSRKK